METTTNVARPEAYIAVGKNRQKINGENTVYLSDKQEFQFEFFNPTTDNIMAKISINGNLISNRGLILRPGMRGWLERYIDQNRKFLFETYSVDGESKAVQKAIADNGNIKIEFFKEKKIGEKTIKFEYYPINCFYYGSINNIDHGLINNIDYGSIKNSDLNQTQYMCTSIDYAPDKCCRDICDMRKLSKSIETGRVEKGDISGQEFKTVDMQFEYMPFFSVSYKLMPISQKPAEFNEMKLKCECGSKIKSNWKLCPICGRPINGVYKCKNCGTKIESAWNFCPTCNNKLK